jgi:hypothetical protein
MPVSRKKRERGWILVPAVFSYWRGASIACHVEAVLLGATDEELMTMRTCRNNLWLGLTLAAVLAAGLPVTAFGADRMVLCEEFTATW